MNGAVFVNVVIVLMGAAVLIGALYVGRRYLPEHHWLRKLLIAAMERRGPLEMVRMVGMVLLICALGALTIVYS
jgi:hypothetical protein